MRIIALALLTATIPTAVLAQTQTQTPAPAASATTAGKHYTTADTDIGTLMDDPAAKAIVEKAIPGFTTHEQIDMARGMTMKAIQQYTPDQLSDAKLAEIDAELAKLPVKK